MKEQNPEMCTAVLAAMQKLNTTQNPDALTLEEVMMCFYERPCRRISPGKDCHFRKYARGSLLVYEQEIVLVLLPEDNTLYFPYERARIVGPKRCYRGLLPRSVFHTTGGTRVYVMDPFKEVSGMRQLMREKAERLKSFPEEANFLAWKNSAGSLNNHRCSEAFGLAGMIGARAWEKKMARMVLKVG